MLDANGSGAVEVAKKKKKKKKAKKKAAAKVEQSEPPRIGLSKLFPDGTYPEGEIQEYKDEYVPLPHTSIAPTPLTAFI